MNRSPPKAPFPCYSPLLSPFGLGFSRLATQGSSTRVARLSFIGHKLDKAAHLSSRKMVGSIDLRDPRTDGNFYLWYKIGQCLQVPWRMVFEPSKSVSRGKNEALKRGELLRRKQPRGKPTRFRFVPDPKPSNKGFPFHPERTGLWINLELSRSSTVHLEGGGGSD